MSERPLYSHSLAARVAVLGLAAFYLFAARWTRGHEADFGKQWLAARLVATGRADQLYDRAVQRTELERHYGQEIIERGIWRDEIGGPTYPPTFALVFAPLGWLAPHHAQTLLVSMSVALVLFSAWMLSRLDDRLSWETAGLLTLSLPSFFFAMGVGQNSAVTLCIVVAGWLLLSRDREFAAGVIWGLLAIKPTWGLALFWLPAALGRGRVYWGMAASSAILVALTLPLCGLSGWLDWLGVARQTEQLYQTLPRWTFLSRDLPGLLRRATQGDWVEIAGWGMVAGVVGITWWMWRTTKRGEFEAVGPRAAALLAAVVLSCPRFMFYDMTLAVAAVVVSLTATCTAADRDSRTLFLFCVAGIWFGPLIGYLRWSMLGPPIETYALVGLWGWAISQSLEQAARSSAPFARSVGSIPYSLPR